MVGAVPGPGSNGVVRVGVAGSAGFVGVSGTVAGSAALLVRPKEVLRGFSCSDEDGMVGTMVMEEVATVGDMIISLNENITGETAGNIPAQ
jgi:hypothetical protein